MPERPPVVDTDTTPAEVVHVRAADVEKKARRALTTGLRSLHAPKWITAPPWVKRPATAATPAPKHCATIVNEMTSRYASPIPSKRARVTCRSSLRPTAAATTSPSEGRSVLDDVSGEARTRR